MAKPGKREWKVPKQLQVEMMKQEEEVKVEERIPIEEKAEIEIAPSVSYCTGCGVKLQTESKEHAGYIDTKLLKRDKEIEHILSQDKEEDLSAEKQENMLIDHLKSIGAS